jgi:arsenate reductase (thioredoxin)
MRHPIKQYCDNLVTQFETISKERKVLLENISNYISGKKESNQPIQLVYICTHNSRRSHFGQIWAQVAANYYNVKNVTTFSGGTEATAFNSNAINAIKRVGFEVKPLDETSNRRYHIVFDETENPIICFSKVYDDAQNPQSKFAAIMTCSDAEENCPFIPGVELRIGTTYDDPKEFDNRPLQDAMYDERCKQIALETLYVFSNVK